MFKDSSRAPLECHPLLPLECIASKSSPKKPSLNPVPSLYWHTYRPQDLATALCAFSSMRRLVASGFLDEFLGEVAEKLPTFSTPALASVLGALGALGYRPQQEWADRVCSAGADRCDCICASPPPITSCLNPNGPTG